MTLVTFESALVLFYCIWEPHLINCCYFNFVHAQSTTIQLQTLEINN